MTYPSNPNRLAFIIESAVTGTQDEREQTIIIPSAQLTIHRNYTRGQRGRGARWMQVLPFNGLVTTTDTDSSYVRGFLLKDRDVVVAQSGIYTTVGVKALAALDDFGIQMDTTHAVAYETVMGMVETATQLGWDATDYQTYFEQSELRAAGIAAGMQTIKPVTTPPKALMEIVEPMPTPAMASATPAPVIELATVPPIKWAEQYLNRKVIGNLTEFDIYDQAIAEGSNVLIEGHAGSGKTMSVMAYAAARGLRFYSVSAHAGIEVSQLFGKWNPTGNPAAPFAWQDGAVTELIKNGNGVLLLNEINFLPERFTTVIFSLLDDRREIQLMDKDGSVLRAASNLLIVGDMNPNYRGTRPMNQAWNDRFSQHRLKFEYDRSIESKIIPSKTLLDMATALRQRFDKEEIETPISTRSLVAFSRNMQSLGLEYAIYSYLNLFKEAERSSIALVIETYKSGLESDATKAGN